MGNRVELLIQMNEKSLEHKGLIGILKRIKDFIIGGPKRFVYEKYFYDSKKSKDKQDKISVIVNSFQRLYTFIRIAA